MVIEKVYIKNIMRNAPRNPAESWVNRPPRIVESPAKAKAKAKLKVEQMVEMLKTSTAAYRAVYVKRAEEIYMSGLRNMREMLAANGMDLNKVAPYPKSNIGRREYRMRIAAHRRYTASFETAESVKHQSLTGMMYGELPWMMVERAGAEEKVRVEARRDANDCFDSFLYKMSGKIYEVVGDNEKIWGATLTGELWDGCRLTVTRSLQTGTRFDPMADLVFNTKCIINQSVYGKLFNQWPTRRQE